MLKTNNILICLLVIIFVSSCAGSGVRPTGNLPPPPPQGGSNSNNNNTRNLVIGSVILGGVITAYFLNSKDDTNEEKEGYLAVPSTIREYQRFVYQHRHAFVKQLSDVKKNYSLYSYLLFGKKILNNGNLSSETRKKYKIALEKIITGTEASVNNFEKETIKHGEIKKYNLYVIPYKTYPLSSDSLSVVDLSMYNFYLSRNILKEITNNLSDVDLATKFEYGEGPFLIATNRPIEKNSALPRYFLYLDMSTLTSAAMESVIQTYQDRLTNPKIGNAPPSNLEKIKLELLQVLLGGNKYIGIFRDAMKDVL